MVKDLDTEEIYLLSNADLGFKILKESKKAMSTADLFKKVCDLKEKSEEYYLDELADYYTELNTDKRFVFLETKEWDVRDNHIIPKTVDEDEEEEEDELIDDTEEDEEEEEEEFDEENLDDEFDEEEEDELKGLSIIEDLED